MHNYYHLLSTKLASYYNDQHQMPNFNKIGKQIFEILIKKQFLMLCPNME